MIDFHEHTLLSYPDLTLTLLKVAQERGQATLEDALQAHKALLRQAHEAPPVSDEEILRHLDHARRNLELAKLLKAVGTEGFQLTARGAEALREHPMGVDDSVLMAYPEFRAAIEGRDTAQIKGAARLPRSMHYDEGYTAFHQGAGLSDNPYGFDTANHLGWENGWYEARDESAQTPPGQTRGVYPRTEETDARVTRQKR